MKLVSVDEVIRITGKCIGICLCGIGAIDWGIRAADHDHRHIAHPFEDGEFLSQINHGVALDVQVGEDETWKPLGNLGQLSSCACSIISFIVRTSMIKLNLLLGTVTIRKMENCSGLFLNELG